MAKLKLMTGVKTYEIEDENGNLLCVISLNTTDLNLFHRISEMEGKVQEAIPDLDAVNDEEAEKLLQDTVLLDADKKIRAIINETFDSEISDKLFGNTNCLSIGPDGSTYVERFLIMIAPVIAADFEESLKQSQQRVNKYTSQVK